MCRFAPLFVLAAAGSLAANAALAQVAGEQDDAISSSAEGALAVPEDWDCDIYSEEYREWLEAGNDPQDWRFAGKSYRAANDGDLYNWQDWLDWSEEQGCLAAVFADPQSAGGGLFGDGMTGVGLVTGFLATGLIAASGGENAKSPG